MANNSKPATVELRTLDMLPVVVALADQKKFLFMNKEGRKLFYGSVAPVADFSKISKKENNSLSLLIGEVLKSRKQQERNIKLFLSGQHYNLRCTASKIGYQGKKVAQLVFTNISKASGINTEVSLLEKISANSQDVIFHFGFNPRLELKFISDSAKNILGYSPEEIYKDPGILRAHLQEEDRQLLVLSKKEYIKRSRANRTRRILVRFVHKSGNIRHLEIAVNPVYESRKVLAGLIGTMRDITERVETEELLLETKNKFDLITRNGNDIVAFYSYVPQEKYLYVSPNIKKILGYEDKQLLQDHTFFSKKLSGPNPEFFSAEDLLKRRQKNNILKNYHFAFKIFNKSNEEVWLENNLVPITNNKGRISFYLNILRDVTEQKESDIEIENQYINYRNLLDSSPVAYVIHDHGVCQYVNNALVKLFKLKNKNQILGKFALDFFYEPDRKRAIQRMQEVYTAKNAPNKFYNYTVHDAEGNPVEIEVKSVVIKFNDRDCILSLVNNLSEQRQREKEKIRTLITETANKQLQKEIRERHEIERSLIEKTAHLSSIFESSTHLIWTVNDRYEVTSFNQNFYEIVKLQHGVEIKQGCRIDDLLTRNREEYVGFWYTKYAEAFRGRKLEFEKEDYNERKIYRKIFLNPIYNEQKKVSEISCIANDITDSKIYEQKLLNQTGKLSAIFDSSHHYIWTIDHEGKLTSFNKNYYDLVTALYNTKPFLGLVLNRGVLANDKEYTELLEFHYGKAFTGAATSFEIETRDKEYKNVYLEIFLNPIFEKGQVVEVSGIAHNITEKKHVQQRMEQSLKEKEVLLREVHHRVKNNMQVISSILNLQSSYVSDEYALTLLKESQNRIKTMAYIHESLYQNKSFASVNFSDYVQTLVNNIVQSYSYSSEKIKVKMNVQRINLSLDSSIPAGLIINELITNAIKHAFPGPRQGTIHLDLTCENNVVCLEFKDDGVGFADGVDFENSHSLGLQLVNTLIEQIEGNLKFKSQKDKGTEVLVTFRM